MNPESHESDALEARLRRTPLAPPPAAWRAEILAAAERAGTTANATMDRDQPRGVWARLRAVPGEWTAAAALVLAVLGLNWPMVADLARADAPMTADRSKEISVEAVTVLMASREALWRELGLEPITESPRVLEPAAPPPEPRRRQLNRTGTNDVAQGWA